LSRSEEEKSWVKKLYRSYLRLEEQEGKEEDEEDELHYRMTEPWALVEYSTGFVPMNLAEFMTAMRKDRNASRDILSKVEAVNLRLFEKEERDLNTAFKKSKNKDDFLESIFTVASLDDKMAIDIPRMSLNLRYVTVREMGPSFTDARLLCGMYKNVLDSFIRNVVRMGDYEHKARQCFQLIRDGRGYAFEDFVVNILKDLELKDLAFCKLQAGSRALADGDGVAWRPGKIHIRKERFKTIEKTSYEAGQLSEVPSDGKWYAHIPERRFNMPVCDVIFQRRYKKGKKSEYILVQITISDPYTHAGSGAERTILIEGSTSAKNHDIKYKTLLKQVKDNRVGFLYLTPYEEHGAKLNIATRNERYRTDVCRYLGHAAISVEDFRYLVIDSFIERNKRFFISEVDDRVESKEDA
jgi:hypothetical protein